jgi:hypothetical protein
VAAGSTVVRRSACVDTPVEAPAVLFELLLSAVAELADAEFESVGAVLAGSICATSLNVADIPGPSTGAAAEALVLVELSVKPGPAVCDQDTRVSPLGRLSVRETLLAELFDEARFVTLIVYVIWAPASPGSGEALIVVRRSAFGAALAPAGSTSSAATTSSREGTRRRRTEPQ